MQLGSRIRAIDGLRGVAVAAVLAYHVSPGSLPGGLLGVEVFFVLSGYLLTSILFEEHRRAGRIDWRGYARRRLRRVGPALLVFLMAVVLVGAVLTRADAHRLRGDVLWSVLGLTNWHLIVDGSSYFNQVGRPPFVRHLWSLAVEIQFYAAIPFLVGWLASRPRVLALKWLAGGIGLSALLMALLYRGADPSRAYYGTDTRVGALLTGALLALALSRARVRGPRPAPLALVLGGAGLACLLVLFLTADERSRWLYPGGFLVCRLATVLVIVAALQPGWFARGLGSRVPRWLGLRSYGIYLWHWPLVVLTRPGIDVGWPPFVSAAAVVAGALVFGHLSFRHLELPFIHPDSAPPLPRRAQRVLVLTRRGNVVVGGLATAVVLFSLPTVDPVAGRLREGEQVLAAQSGPPVTPAPTSSAPPATSAPVDPAATLPIDPAATVPPATTEPPAPAVTAPLTVTAIGDSVMLSAAAPLRDGFGAAAYIDAKLRRQFVEGVEEVRKLREGGQLGQVVFVHLGTNGRPRDSDIDALMAELAAVPYVFLVTVRMPKRWEGETNEALWAAAQRHPTIRVVDWYGYSEGHREWFESDATHMKPAGARAYAELLAASLPGPPA